MTALLEDLALAQDPGDGELEAFEQFGPALKHARRFCRDPLDAEDAVQAGYLALLRRLQAGTIYGPGTRWRGLVCGYARHYALRAMRRAQVRWRHGGTLREDLALQDLAEEDELARLPAAMVVVDRYADPYEVERVRGALGRMRAQDAHLLWRFHVWGVACRELATEAGCTEEAMEKRLTRARRAFRATYAQGA